MGTSVAFDEHALALVQRFSWDWDHRPANVVNGPLHYVLQHEYGVTRSRSLLEAVDAVVGRRLGLDITRKPVDLRAAAILDEQTAALVRRYLEESPQDYTAAEVISGCVSYAQGYAFENLEHRRRYFPQDDPGFTRDGRRFVNGGWGYVETLIANVRRRRDGQPEYDGNEAAKGYERADKDPDDNSFAAGRRPAGDPADVALLAAAKPEAVEDLPLGQRGEQPTPPTKGNGKRKHRKDREEGKWHGWSRRSSSSRFSNGSP